MCLPLVVVLPSIDFQALVDVLILFYTELATEAALQTHTTVVETKSVASHERKKAHPVAEALDNALRMFSFDIVKMIASYIIHPNAAKDELPKLLLSIGSEGEGDGQFRSIGYGCACSPIDNSLWVASATKVQVFTSEGEFVRQVGVGQWKDTCGIAFGSDGCAYIVDYMLGCVNVYRPDGTFDRRISSFGMQDGQLKNPWYVAIDNKQGLLFVTDDRSRVQVFTLGGSFVRSWGSYGGAEGKFDWPRGIAVNDACEVAVAGQFERV